MQALGNHEFDNGAEGLEPFLHNVTFPVLSCNINASNDPFIDGLFAPSVVLHVDGERVAVVGYTTDETRFLVEQGGCMLHRMTVRYRATVISKIQEHGLSSASLQVAE